MKDVFQVLFTFAPLDAAIILFGSGIVLLGLSIYVLLGWKRLNAWLIQRKARLLENRRAEGLAEKYIFKLIWVLSAICWGYIIYWIFYR